jgi:hypothetical protein
MSRTAALLLLSACWLAATGSVARANVSLDFQGSATSATVQRTTDPAVSLTLFQFIDSNCGGACVSYFEVRTPQRITLTPGTTGCSPPQNVNDRSVYRCGRLPVRTSVTLGPGPDALEASGTTGAGICPDPAVTAQGFGGNDRLTGGCANDALDGGDGPDLLAAGEGDNQIAGGAGDDALTAGAGADSLVAGTGADTLDAGAGADSLSGGPGKDSLEGGAGADDLSGDEDADSLSGGPGDDVLRGGAGRDVVAPGSGQDRVEGGPDVDTVLYDDRVAPVTVTLTGGADDGEGGEADDVSADVENVVTGAGADLIVGSGGANEVDAGPGNDRIDPGAGPDSVQGGAGDDFITTLDGVQDRVDCGEGSDTAVIDAFDTVTGCEAVSASRELMSDVDNDGIAAPFDCNDRDPLRRPGLPDRPENGIDEDCVAGDARFPRVLATVTANFGAVRSRAKVVRLVANDVPDTATITIACSGRGCFRGTRRRALPNGARKVDLIRQVRRLRLRRGAVLDVRILRDESIGRVFQFKVGKRTQVTSAVRCLRPGARAPSTCPRS